MANNSFGQSAGVDFSNQFLGWIRMAVQGQSNGANSHIKLPTLKVKTFDGTLSNWLKFKASYESCIPNNKSLDSVHKMQYLQMYVEGKASQIISKLELSPENYDPAVAEFAQGTAG